MSTRRAILVGTIVLGVLANVGVGQPVSVSDIQIFSIVPAGPGGVDNTRGDAANAFDGDPSSISFLTPAFTNTPHVVAMDLGAALDVNRIRVDKIGDTDGTGSGAPGLGPIDNMDLQLVFTTDLGPLNTRSYAPVTGLTNGFGGAELIDADAVNAADAMVDNDHHEGIYSLTFDTVSVTGLGLQFARDAADSADFAHYAAKEIELLDGAASLAIVGHQVFSAPTPAGVQLNNRGDEGLAIDGDVNTASFLTPSFTDSPHVAALDLGGPVIVNRLRVAKGGDTDQAGDSSGAPGLGPIDNMDLQVLFTTDVGPLHERGYQPVSGLSDGFAGTELIQADAVDAAAAAVDNDHHDFSDDGWYSLSFDPVEATGLAVRFARDGGDSAAWTHYYAFELEVHEVPEPTCLFMALIGALAVVNLRRVRR